MNIAAANGWPEAKSDNPILALEMTPDQIAQAEALAKEMTAKNPKLLNKQPPSLPQVPLGFSIFNLLA